MTNQGNIIETIKTNLGISNLSLGYEAALFALFQSAGITNTEFNGAFIEYLQLVLNSTKTNINDLLAEYAELFFDGNVNSINDLSRPAYIFTVKTDNAGTSSNDQFTLPLISGGTYDFNIDWGDSSDIDHITAYNQAEVTHTFSGGAGTYEVKVYGRLTGWAFNNGGDKLKYLKTKQVGIFSHGNEEGAFYGCLNHEWEATDAGNLKNSVSLNGFWRANPLVTSIPQLKEMWTSATTSIQAAFYDSGFNDSIINEVDSSSILSYTSALRDAPFNQNINNLNFESIDNTSRLTNFLSGSDFDDDNYELLLLSMIQQTILAGQTPHFGTAKWKFRFGGQARFDMLADGTFASVTDGGQSDSSMGAWFNPHNVLKATANPADGTTISSWKDLSDNGLNAEDATNGPRFDTNVANGEPMLYFNGTDTRLDVPADAALDALFNSGGFFICAILPDSDGQSNQGRVFSQGGGNCHLSLRDESAGTCRLRFLKSFDTTSGVWDSVGLDINLNEINIIAMEYDSSDVANDPVIYINSTTATSITESSTPVGTPSTPSGIQIGNAGFSNRTFDGHIGDLGFFKSIPSSTVREERINYLATKYGVTLS